MSDAQETVRIQYIFHGRVQGVGFRFMVKQHAVSLGMTGWVKNEYDGTVLMELQGPESRHRDLLYMLGDDRYINITEIEKKRLPVKADEKKFRTLGW